MDNPKIKYVDFYFYACLDELFAVENSYWKTDLNGNEISELAKSLNININIPLVVKNYWNEEINNIEIFHSSDDDLVFLYLDIRRMRTDQNDIFLFGVRCTEFQKENIMNRLMSVYDLLKTTGSFNYDKWGWKFYSLNGSYRIEQSSEYQNGGKIIHHR
ncbi:hypothetical protein JM658_16520 [Joostella atrarenae]|uniref:Uncharacterized protein n=1 Tax=Joostella atrarenae TaxID=679257 RepID=A0ABS9J7M6_9FLAO|nr:hypothetical protein [Joostella atrarenae]MCF8716433.1 hypothetical protein [Joostella atrarenae]